MTTPSTSPSSTPDFVMGSAFSIRGWRLTHYRNRRLALHGARVNWLFPELISQCYSCGDKPKATCTCGIYSYWSVKEASQINPYTGNYRGNDQLLAAGVVGVIENYGHVVIGGRGCRAGKARIRALTLSVNDPLNLFSERLTEEIIKQYSVPVFDSVSKMLLEYPLSSDYYDPDSGSNDFGSQAGSGAAGYNYVNHHSIAAKAIKKVPDGCYARSAQAQAYIMKYADVIVAVQGNGIHRKLSDACAFMQAYKSQNTLITPPPNADGIKKMYIRVGVDPDTQLPPPGVYSRITNDRLKRYIELKDEAGKQTFTYHNGNGKANGLTKATFLQKFNDGWCYPAE